LRISQVGELVRLEDIELFLGIFLFVTESFTN